MTHIDNISHAVKYGITHRNSLNANLNYISIGDSSLIGNRNSKIALVNNGNNNYGFAESIIIGDFIPFYFGFRTPMLYVIQKGGNFVPNITPAEKIIYCVSSVQKIIDSKLLFFFTDGHATNNLTTFFSSERALEINSLVDLKAANSKYWKDDSDLDLKRRKESELLIKNDVPNSCILGYICYDESAKNELLTLGLSKKEVVIRPNYYF